VTALNNHLINLLQAGSCKFWIGIARKADKLLDHAAAGVLGCVKRTSRKPRREELHLRFRLENFVRFDWTRTGLCAAGGRDGTAVRGDGPGSQPCAVHAERLPTALTITTPGACSECGQ